MTFEDEIKNISAISASMATKNYEYTNLSSKLLVSILHKETFDKFSDYLLAIKGIISEDFYNNAQFLTEEVDKIINYDYDYDYDYFGYKTLEKSFLLKINDKIVERPQQMFMRVAIFIHCNDKNDTNIINNIKETYLFMAKKYFIHASPTLFNAGLKFPQLSSCFLMKVKEDSFDGTMETVKQCASICKYTGGIGLSVTDLRAEGSKINGVYFLKIYYY